MGKKKPVSTVKKKKETAVLIGVQTRYNRGRINEHLDELAFLVKTSGAEAKKRFIQRLRAPNPKTFIGSGKMEEVKQYVDEHGIDTVVFDDELTPSQVRNVEEILRCKILDRSDLILAIFARRARTSHAKTQVELAQYENLLPRLTGRWPHLQKQKGGIGTKGPGEREIETDRRIIRDKITFLKKKLKKIEKQKANQRKNRGKLVRAALIGYTNAGKSTILNQLSSSEIFVEDKLFATLDTTVRKIELYNVPLLLTDTVGFIRKLPHKLVESFKSTLDEVREADVLIHVIDISHPNFEDHYRVVSETLAEIGAADKPTLLVFNKLDEYRAGSNGQVPYQGDQVDVNGQTLPPGLEDSWMNKIGAYPSLFISATGKRNIRYFKDVLYERVKAIHAQRYPYDDFLY